MNSQEVDGIGEHIGNLQEVEQFLKNYKNLEKNSLIRDLIDGGLGMVEIGKALIDQEKEYRTEWHNREIEMKNNGIVYGSDEYNIAYWDHNDKMQTQAINIAHEDGMLFATLTYLGVDRYANSIENVILTTIINDRSIMGI